MKRIVPWLVLLLLLVGCAQDGGTEQLRSTGAVYMDVPSPYGPVPCVLVRDVGPNSRTVAVSCGWELLR